MKMTYDPKADAVYIYLNKNSITGTVPVSPDLIVDYDKHNLPVGIEMLSVSKIMSKKSLSSVKIKLLSRPKALSK